MAKAFLDNHFSPQLKLEAIQKSKLMQYLYDAFLRQQKIFFKLFFAADKLLSPAHSTFEVLKIFKL
ncbi:hypothetical protein N4T20_03900 [Flavobacterium sp. TR2]|uniref:hypothetical protein n=1 Tax=Flavobacterium sp. TR2 TaxID=2977321 RepID=UPI0021B1310A|nr:hypothetical protein [Flavobacterium sp. TR2]UWY29073.1 hypothetical protein N4T20_03900 [Flavobacterium sp. TR2]